VGGAGPKRMRIEHAIVRGPLFHLGRFQASVSPAPQSSARDRSPALPIFRVQGGMDLLRHDPHTSFVRD
jgi:hypothetical protein